MSRRVNQLAVALLALSLSLPAPSAFAARRDLDNPGSFRDRVEQIIKVLKRAFTPVTTVNFPQPPIP
ncbi:MAG TPA: hypothetical protein VMS98_20735 [Thermoanaerobaculia bacterium]|nr:hypothetical protein [Thermoanaerobaculia bacterium]